MLTATGHAQTLQVPDVGVIKLGKQVAELGKKVEDVEYEHDGSEAQLQQMQGGHQRLQLGVFRVRN